MLQGRTNVYIRLVIISLSTALQLSPIFALGIAMMVAKYRESFNPASKDSIYSPDVQRKTAYILLGLALLEGITGFGAGPQTSSFITPITLGLLNRGLSLQLHLLLIAPLVFVFILHSTSGIGSMLIRRGVKSKLVYEFVLPFIMLSLFAIGFYLSTLYY